MIRSCNSWTLKGKQNLNGKCFYVSLVKKIDLSGPWSLLLAMSPPGQNGICMFCHNVEVFVINIVGSKDISVHLDGMLHWKYNLAIISTNQHSNVNAFKVFYVACSWKHKGIHELDTVRNPSKELHIYILKKRSYVKGYFEEKYVKWHLQNNFSCMS